MVQVSVIQAAGSTHTPPPSSLPPSPSSAPVSRRARPSPVEQRGASPTRILASDQFDQFRAPPMSCRDIGSSDIAPRPSEQSRKFVTLSDAQSKTVEIETPAQSQRPTIRDYGSHEREHSETSILHDLRIQQEIDININSRILEIYIKNIIPSICKVRERGTVTGRDRPGELP